MPWHVFPAQSAREHGIPDETPWVAPWHTRDAYGLTLSWVFDLRLQRRKLCQSHATNQPEDGACPSTLCSIFTVIVQGS
jgi:hypothetical protein